VRATSWVFILLKFRTRSRTTFNLEALLNTSLRIDPWKSTAYDSPIAETAKLGLESLAASTITVHLHGPRHARSGLFDAYSTALALHAVGLTVTFWQPRCCPDLLYLAAERPSRGLPGLSRQDGSGAARRWWVACGCVRGQIITISLWSSSEPEAARLRPGQSAPGAGRVSWTEFSFRQSTCRRFVNWPCTHERPRV